MSPVPPDKFSWQDTADRTAQLYIDARESNDLIYGVPFIEVNSKALVMLRGYGRDKTRLSFVYKVGPGEETPAGQRLTMAPNTTINLNGATIRDESTDLDAILTPVPTFGETLGLLGPSALLPTPRPERLLRHSSAGRVSQTEGCIAADRAIKVGLRAD